MRLTWPFRGPSGQRQREWVASRRALLLLVPIVLIAGLFGLRALMEQARVALPGDGLFTVRRAGEQLALLITPDEVGKAKLHTSLLRTRVHDIETLAVTGRYEAVPQGVQELRAEIDNTADALRAVAEQDPAQGVALVQQAEQVLNDSTELLAMLALKGPRGAQPILDQAVAVVVGGEGVLLAQLPDATRQLLERAGPTPTLSALAATAQPSSRVARQTIWV